MDAPQLVTNEPGNPFPKKMSQYLTFRDLTVAPNGAPVFHKITEDFSPVLATDKLRVLYTGQHFESDRLTIVGLPVLKVTRVQMSYAEFARQYQKGNPIWYDERSPKVKQLLQAKVPSNLIKANLDPSPELYNLILSNPNKANRAMLTSVGVDGDFISRQIHLIRNNTPANYNYKASVVFHIDIHYFGDLITTDSNQYNLTINKTINIRGDAHYLNQQIQELIQSLQSQYRAIADSRLRSGINIGSIIVRDFSITLAVNGYIGSHVEVHDSIKDILYNPETDTDCVFKCLEQYGITADYQQKAAILKGYRIQSFAGVPMSKFKLLFETLNPSKTHVFIVYKFHKETGDIGRPIVYNKADHIQMPVHLLVHHNHMMVIRDITRVRELKAHLIRPVEREEADITRLMMDVKYKEIKVHEELLNINRETEFTPKSKRMYCWDVETAKDQVTGQHKIIGVVCIRHDQVYGYQKSRNDPMDGKYFIKDIADIEASSMKFYGLDALDKFLTHLTYIAGQIHNKIAESIKDELESGSLYKAEQLKRRLIKEHELVFFAHNAARYDDFFLLEKIKGFVGGLTDVVKKNGYASLTFHEVIVFRDSYKHMSNTLADLCNTWLVPKALSKGDMPYDFVYVNQKQNNIYHQGSIYETEGYWKSWPAIDNLKPLSDAYNKAISDWCDITGVNPLCFYLDDYKFDLAEHIKKYMLIDVIALMIICHRYNYTMYQISKSPITGSGLYALDFISGPAFSYAYFMMDINFDQAKLDEYIERTSTLINRSDIVKVYNSCKVPEDQRLYVCTDYDVDTIIRDTIYGGRVFVAKGHYENPMYDDYVGMKNIAEDAEVDITNRFRDPKYQRVLNIVAKQLTNELVDSYVPEPIDDPDMTPEDRQQSMDIDRYNKIMERVSKSVNKETVNRFIDNLDKLLDSDDNLPDNEYVNHARGLILKAVIKETRNNVMELCKVMADTMDITIDEAYDNVKESKDFLVALDGSSLYPSTMFANDYPTGRPYLMLDTKHQEYMDKLNSQQPLDKYSVLEVDFTIPNKAVHFPIVAAKFKNGQTLYDCYDKYHYRCTSVDLQQYIKYNGVKVTRIHWVIEWPGKRFLFTDKMKKIYEMRLDYKRAGNGVMSECTKLMMNGFYGKTCQNRIDSKIVIASSNEEVCKLFNEGKVSHYFDLIGAPDETDPTGDGYRLIIELKLNPETSTKKELNKTVNRCPHLGAFTLAHSKRLMNEVVDALGGFQDHNVVLYGDTDSVYVKQSEYLKFMWVPIPEDRRDEIIAKSNEETEMIKAGTLSKYNRLHFVDPTKKYMLRQNPYGRTWVTYSDDPDDSYMTQFHDDTDGKVKNPKIMQFVANAPKVKTVDYACDLQEKIETYEDCDFFMVGVRTDNSPIMVPQSKKKIVTKGPLQHSMKSKANFKGFTKSAVVTNILNGGMDYKQYFGKDKLSSLYKLNSRLLLLMKDPDARVEIQYTSFKRDTIVTTDENNNLDVKTRTGCSIATITTTKLLNNKQWAGRYNDNDTYFAYGSSFVPEEENKKKFAEIISTLEPKGGFHY